MSIIKKIITIFVAIIVVIFLFLSGVYYWFEISYSQKIYPGVRIGDTVLSGKSLTQARNILNQQIDKLSQDGITFQFSEKEIKILPVINKSPTGDIVDILIDFDIEKTISQAISTGRSDNLIQDMIDRSSLFLFTKSVDLVFQIEEEKIMSKIKTEFFPLEGIDAKYYVKDGKLLIQEDRVGKQIDYEQGLQELNYKLKQLDFSNIILADRGIKNPEITKADCVSMIEKAQEIVNLAPITLRYGGQAWPLTKEVLADWIVLSKDKTNPVKPILTIYLDKDKIYNYLKKEIEPKIDEPAKAAKFTLQAGKLKEIKTSTAGLELNILLAIEALADLPNNHLKILNLSASRVLNEDIQINTDLGIKEKIGTATTKIIDSTEKRIYNIKQGSSIINGILIAPNEEFSLLKLLSPFDETNGYIKEMVIQDGVFKADYGGGLCQLSTTVFRAIIDAGLPVTERTNHSYWLHYYSPPGTDATIFEPKPDLKFINDTGQYILLNAQVNADLDLTIDLWGAKDGRIITKTEPVVYNIIYPGNNFIYTKALAPGVKNCTVYSYNGADVYFDYKVIYKDGTIKENRFSSHYIPHKGLCYVGY